MCFPGRKLQNVEIKGDQGALRIRVNMEGGGIGLHCSSLCLLYLRITGNPQCLPRTSVVSCTSLKVSLKVSMVKHIHTLAITLLFNILCVHYQCFYGPKGSEMSYRKEIVFNIDFPKHVDPFLKCLYLWAYCLEALGLKWMLLQLNLNINSCGSSLLPSKDIWLTHVGRKDLNKSVKSVWCHKRTQLLLP